MEPEVFFGLVAIILIGVLAIKYKVIRTIIGGTVLFALFFLVGWGLI